jgi:hypothetical protein
VLLFLFGNLKKRRIFAGNKKIMTTATAISPTQLQLLHRLSESSLPELEMQLLEVVFKKIHSAFQPSESADLTISTDLREELLQLGIALIDQQNNKPYVINPIKDSIDIELLRKQQGYSSHQAKAIFGKFPIENTEYQALINSTNA